MNYLKTAILYMHFLVLIIAYYNYDVTDTES